MTTTASIGISVYPSDGEESDVLMKNADVAMYQAKENGRNAYHFHDESMNAAALARTDLENGLRRGLARNEFLLRYQPQIAARSGDIAGLDAQLFWRHPQHGMLPAAEFIAASEDATVVTPMSEWLVRSACLQLRAWNAMGLPTLYLSLTLPPGAAERGDLPRLVREASAQAGVDPGLLMLGFGSIPGTRVSLRTLDAMQALQDMGARLILDDLGNGPASFSSLGQYPLSMVRLEASFLRGLARDGDLADGHARHDPHGARAQPGRGRDRRGERRARLPAARDGLRPRAGPRVRDAGGGRGRSCACCPTCASFSLRARASISNRRGR